MDKLVMWTKSNVQSQTKLYSEIKELIFDQLRSSIHLQPTNCINSSLYLLTILCVSIIKLHDAHFFKLRDCWCVLLISEADVEMRMQDEHINYKVMCHPFLLFLSQTELINEKRPWMKQKSSICMQYQEGSHVPRLPGELLRQKMNRMTKGHQN